MRHGSRNIVPYHAMRGHIISRWADRFVFRDIFHSGTNKVITDYPIS